jgi:trehalose 6-phosphate phosphatase
LRRNKDEKLEEFLNGLPGAANALLLLDYDGTLAPFRVDRFRATPWAGIRVLLNEIQKQGKTRIEVISGRPATEVAQLIGLETQPTVWGLHGLERLDSEGRRTLENIAPETRAKLEEVWAQLAGNTLGGLFEAKPNAAVMHWRGLDKKKKQRIEARTRELFEPLAHMEGLQLLEFECGLELRAGRDKGGAVTAILDEAQEGGVDQVSAAYLGDDFTDESAFAAMKGRGLSVLVRGDWRPTVADAWIRPPEQLRAFLRAWRDAQGPDTKAVPNLRAAGAQKDSPSAAPASSQNNDRAESASSPDGSDRIAEAASGGAER